MLGIAYGQNDSSSGFEILWSTNSELILLSRPMMSTTFPELYYWTWNHESFTAFSPQSTASSITMRIFTCLKMGEGLGTTGPVDSVRYIH